MNAPSRVEVSWLELLLLVFLVLSGIGFCAVARWQVTSSRASQRPREEQFLHKHGVTVQEMELAVAREELALKQKGLAEQRLAIVQQQALSDSLAALYPDVRSASPVTSTATVSEEVMQAYRDAEVKLMAAQQAERALADDVKSLRKTIADLTLDAATAKHEAGLDFARAQSGFQAKQVAIVVGVAGGLTAVLSGISFLALRRVHGAQAISQRGIAMIVAGLTIVAALFGYSLFGLRGALGAILLPLWLIGLVGLLLLLVVGHARDVTPPG